MKVLIIIGLAVASVVAMVDVALTTGELDRNFVEEDVVWNPGGWQVHGTITIPLADGPFPAVMLIAGSGPTDREWNNPGMPGNNGSARLLAHRLAENGYVVLRYDKFGVGQTNPPPEVQAGDALLTLAHPMAEQMGGLDVLRSDPRVDPSRVFVAGHSEGGRYAMRLAEELESGLAGVILLAAGGRGQGESVAQQIGDRLTSSGIFTDEQVDEQVTAVRDALDHFVATGETVDPATVSDIPNLQNLLASYFNPATVPWSQWMLSYSAAEAFARHDLPVLIVQGEKDQQAHPELDGMALWRGAQSAGRTNVVLALCPNADHVLKYEATPVDALTPALMVAYNAEDRRLDPDVVEAVLTWLADQSAATEP